MASQIAAQLYTLRDQIKTLDGFKDTLEKLHTIGYEHVEIAMPGDYSYADIKAALDASGMQAMSVHVSWPECLEQLDGVLEKLSTVGASYATIGMLPKEYYNAAGLDRFINELPPVSEKLRAAKQWLAFHNHSLELTWVGSKPWLAELYARTTGEQLMAELDTYWLQHGGADPAQWIASMMRRVPLLHMKDMIATDEWKPRFAEVGHGNLNWSAIVHAARAADVQWFIIEQDDCFGRDPIEALGDSFRYVKSLGIA